MGFFETIAIDVVLLPPPEVAAAALALNQRLIEQTGDRSIVLDPSGCLPHVSLAMRSIPRRTLPSLTASANDCNWACLTASACSGLLSIGVGGGSNDIGVSFRGLRSWFGNLRTMWRRRQRL